MFYYENKLNLNLTFVLTSCVILGKLVNLLEAPSPGI